MSRPQGFWSVEDRLSEISVGGDPLEVLNRTVDFEMFRPILERAAGGRVGAKCGRPAKDVVLKFRMLVLQSFHGLRLVATKRLVRDRLSWMRFCGLGLADPVPDANTLWDFRAALIRADALTDLFQRLDHAINGEWSNATGSREAAHGFLSRGGQIVDATLVATPRQRNSDGEKAAIKDGKSAAEIWPDQPAKARQKDTHARWTMKSSKAKPVEGKSLVDIAIPGFGYKSHISIDRDHGRIRKGLTTDASAHDGAR